MDDVAGAGRRGVRVVRQTPCKYWLPVFTRVAVRVRVHLILPAPPIQDADHRERIVVTRLLQFVLPTAAVPSPSPLPDMTAFRVFHLSPRPLNQANGNWGKLRFKPSPLIFETIYSV